LKDEPGICDVTDLPSSLALAVTPLSWSASDGQPQLGKQIQKVQVTQRVSLPWPFGLLLLVQGRFIYFLTIENA